MGKNTIKSRALILRKTKYREADLILTALNADGTKISLLARGALRSKKRFSGGILEPTHFVEIHYKPGQGESGISVLEEATLIDGFPGLRQSYERMEVAFFILEALSRVSQEGDLENEGLFNLAGHSLRALEKVNEVGIFKLHFCLKFLLQQGTLEPEKWMVPYLKTPMAEHPSITGENEDPQKDLHLIWAENRLREYLSTGMLST